MGKIARLTARIEQRLLEVENQNVEGRRWLTRLMHVATDIPLVVKGTRAHSQDRGPPPAC